jgi:hypothetical protein
MPAIGTDRVTGFGARHLVSHTIEMMLASLNLIWGGVLRALSEATLCVSRVGRRLDGAVA